MSNHQITYLVFAIVLIGALIADLGLLNKKHKTITIKASLMQTLLWVGLALAFFVFLIFEGKALSTENIGTTNTTNTQLSLEFISAYLMEWSLSIDNIFIFILIFKSFNVQKKYHGRVLLIGILMAIVFRIIFITIGIALVNQFHFILYLFGAFLIYTGYKMFTAGDDENIEPHDTRIYKWLKKIFPLANNDGDGKFFIKENGKRFFTSLFVVVAMLAFTDLVFALDSIPAVMGISNDSLIIYTSNIFAVLGLRSLFFLLQGAVSRFDYLQQGIAIVLIFIGIKMLGEEYLLNYISKPTLIVISLGMIVCCIAGSIAYSVYKKKKI